MTSEVSTLTSNEGPDLTSDLAASSVEGFAFFFLLSAKDLNSSSVGTIAEIFDTTEVALETLSSNETSSANTDLFEILG
jgi:hypothetical protein